MTDFVETLEAQLPTLQGNERLEALNQLANYFYQRDNQRALKMARQGHNLALKLGVDDIHLAECLLQIGRAQSRLTNFEDAESKLGEALTLFKKLGDKFGQARCQISFGNIYLRRNHYSKTLEYYLAALALYRVLRDKRGERECLDNIGIVYSDLGDYAVALDYHTQALRIAQSNKDALNEKEPLLSTELISLNIGYTLMCMERLEESLEYYQQALESARAVGNNYCENNALIGICEIYLRKKRHDLARPLLDKALALARRLRHHREEILVLGLLGRMNSALCESETARQFYQQGLTLLRTYHYPQEEIRLLLNFSEEFLLFVEVDNALAVLSQALELAQRTELFAESCRVHELFAAAYEQRGDFRQALSHFRLFHSLKKKLHDEKQDKRLEVLLVQNQVEKTRQIAHAQRAINKQLQRANKDLAEANRRNQFLLEKVQYQAQHDGLTGLPNRNLFADRLSQAVVFAAHHGKNFAVMFLDLDGFKIVNDLLGHNAGDELLIQVAVRLKSVLREGDTVARLGGDEFTVIAGQISEPESATVVARKLLETLQAPFEIHGHKVSIGASIGVSLYPKDGQDIATLQKYADIAMYTVKNTGKRDIRFFSPEMIQG